MLYQLLRPSDFDGIFGNKSVVKALQKYCRVDPDKRNHAVLFHGPSGCGKTTLARIVAHEVGAEDLSIIELNAANTRGIDTIREIQANAQLLPAFGDAKVYIIDESHQLTKAAQEALLKVMEDYPLHAYYFMCTTAPENLIKTIRNRCVSYQVSPLDRDTMIEFIVEVCDVIEFKPSEDIVEAIAHLAEGSSRVAVVSLEQIMELDDEEVMLDLLVKGSQDDPETIELCKLMMLAPKLRLKRWKEAIRLASQLTASTESETVRRSVIGFLGYKLTASTSIDDARDYARLIEIFGRSTMYSGKGMLFAMVLQACSLQ